MIPVPIMTVAEVLERDAQLRALLPTLVEGEDYDPGPGGLFGSAAPSLLQPGAEKLATIFGLSLVSRVTHRVEDFTGQANGEPLVTYEVTCDAMLGGALVCSGIGICTSAEPGFRWRWVGVHDVPPGMDLEGLQVQRGNKTEPAFAVDRAETTGQYGKPAEYWAEFRAAIDAGEAIPGSKVAKTGRDMPTWTIETALVRIPNPDMAVLANPILKRAKKRAVVAAVVTAIGGLSALMTQDAEEETGLPRRAAPASAKAPDGGRRAAGVMTSAIIYPLSGSGLASDSKAPGQARRVTPDGSADDVAADAAAADAGEPWGQDGSWTAAKTPAPADPGQSEPKAAEWSATPAIDGMRSAQELLGAAGVMALISEQLRGNVYHRNQAWAKALAAGCLIALDGGDIGAIETAWDKVRALISRPQNAAVADALAKATGRVFGDDAGFKLSAAAADAGAVDG